MSTNGANFQELPEEEEEAVVSGNGGALGWDAGLTDGVIDEARNIM